MPVSHRDFAAVDNAVRRHNSSGYRVTYSETMIEVFRRYDADVDDMLASFGIGGRSGQPPRSGSAPLLRFLLQDEQARTFALERFEDGVWQRKADDLPARSLAQHAHREMQV